MNKAGFIRRLRKQCCPPPGIPQDCLGGYLVPEVVLKNKDGLLAAVYRRLGLWLRNESLYEKGTFNFNYKEALIKLAGEREEEA